MWRFWLIECFNFCPHDDFIQFFNNLVPTFFTDSGILQKSSTKRWILGQILLFFISTLKSDFMFLICLCSSVYAFQICRIGSVSELLNKEELCGGATDDYYYTHQGINLTYTVQFWWLINDIIMWGRWGIYKGWSSARMTCNDFRSSWTRFEKIITSASSCPQKR